MSDRAADETKRSEQCKADGWWKCPPQIVEERIRIISEWLVSLDSATILSLEEMAIEDTGKRTVTITIEMKAKTDALNAGKEPE
jgi:hypothetical protein